ncbi:MAG: helix-turn-helix domain-containing protein, partial [Candidatus Diapherotrites archaeon]|nr:helix-turn-helix domain-containing protein [Candidatus Diapherotrites archaeon]
LMDAEIFRDLGLSGGEIKVYLALVRLGESSIGKIGSQSRVSKSKVYDILDRLIDKGLVGYIIKNGVKHFLANDSQTLLEYIQKKEERLSQTRRKVEQILPQLELQRRTFAASPFAEITEGFHGLKTVREELMNTLEPGNTMLIFGAPRIANEKWEAWLLNFHRKREAKKIRMKILYNSNAREFGAKRKRFALSQIRYLPNDLVSPNWIDIFNDAVLFCFVLETPLALVVRDKSLADSFRAYFDIMWKASKK